VIRDNKVTKKWKKSKIRKTLGPILAIVGLFYTYRSHLDACPREVIFAAWALLPPIWLILEYWLLFDRNEESSKDFETFKHSQSLARNLWGGFLIFLVAFYSGVFVE
jgi:hypothetical protein